MHKNKNQSSGASSIAKVEMHALIILFNMVRCHVTPGQSLDEHNTAVQQSFFSTLSHRGLNWKRGHRWATCSKGLFKATESDSGVDSSGD